LPFLGSSIAVSAFKKPALAAASHETQEPACTDDLLDINEETKAML
jgi:hypothetical protein